MMRIIKEKTLKEYAESYPDAAKDIYKWMKKVKASDCCINTRDFLKVWPSTDLIDNKRFACDIVWNRYRLIIGIVPNKPRTIYIRWFGKHRDYDRLMKSGRIYDI